LYLFFQYKCHRPLYWKRITKIDSLNCGATSLNQNRMQWDLANTPSLWLTDAWYQTRPLWNISIIYSWWQLKNAFLLNLPHKIRTSSYRRPFKNSSSSFFWISWGNTSTTMTKIIRIECTTTFSDRSHMQKKMLFIIRESWSWIRSIAKCSWKMQSRH
jgi:hypothetical protein